VQQVYRIVHRKVQPAPNVGMEVITEEVQYVYKKHYTKRNINKLGVVVHIYISSTWEAVAERSQVQSQLG
jgi:hypothetical protein